MRNAPRDLFFRLSGRGAGDQALDAAILQQVIENKWKIAIRHLSDNHPVFVMRMLHSGNTLK
jgi:hypothetical protein